MKPVDPHNWQQNVQPGRPLLSTCYLDHDRSVVDFSHALDAGEDNLNNILQQTRRDRALYRQGSSTEMKIEFLKVIRVGTHDRQSLPSQFFHCLGGFWLTLQIVRFQCIPFVS